MWPRTSSRQFLVGLLGFLLSFIGPRWLVAASSINYSTTSVDPNGAKHDVGFQGSRDGGSISGTLSVDQLSLQVTATVLGDTFSGTLRTSNGKAVASFTGKRTPQQTLEGTLVFGSTTKTWSVPASGLPPLTDK